MYCLGKFRLAVFNTQPPHLYFGGVERRIIETSRRVSSQADVTVYCGTKRGFRKPTNLNGIQVVPCYSTDRLYPLDNWFFNRSLQKQAGIFDADIYEAHNVSGYGFPNALKNRHVNKPFIHVVHGPLSDEYRQGLREHQSPRGKLANLFMRYQARLEQQTAMRASVIIAVSNYSKQRIIEDYSIEEDKIRVVPNGIDPEIFRVAEDSTAIKRQFGLGDDPCVLFVGSLIPRKGLNFLVDAAQKILKQHAQTKFMIVGKGPLKDQIVNAINKRGFWKNFLFVDSLKDETLAVAYRCADVFVLPSVQEGQGIVLLEAEASGKPVVAFSVGGVPEAVRDGETGLLVQFGDTEAFAKAVARLLSDEDLRRKMGAAARKFVVENFTWDICAQKMLQVYREALET